MKVDSLVSELSSDLTLKDRVYKGTQFGDFSLLPKLGNQARVDNCSFENCKLINGSFAMMKGVRLKDVTFLNFKCSGVMNFNSLVHFDNVKIIGGNKSTTLLIKPQGPDIPLPEASGQKIDISEYVGEVSITGFPVEAVKYDPDLHVLVEADWLEKVDWKGLGFNPLSYWGLMAKKASLEGRAGIFSMPPKSGRNYERSIRELDILKKFGFVGI